MGKLEKSVATHGHSTSIIYILIINESSSSIHSLVLFTLSFNTNNLCVIASDHSAATTSYIIQARQARKEHQE
jgi:hypothetical protein